MSTERQYRAAHRSNELAASGSWDSVPSPQLLEGLSSEVARKFRAWELRRYGRVSNNFNEGKKKK